MATSRDEIKQWFDDGVAAKAAFMIVVCDTFDHEDYPIHCNDAKSCREQFDEHHGKNMQRVMEVYDLSLGWDAQSNGRVMNLPERGEERP